MISRNPMNTTMPRHPGLSAQTTAAATLTATLA